MKILEFTYTKAGGDVSNRVLVELVKPTSHVEGVDITSLSYDDYAEFVTEMHKLEQEIYTKRSELYAKFDLTHNYRRFVPERMSDVKQEYVA